MGDSKDGGCYGWIIVVASFTIQMMVAGGGQSMGVFILEFTRYFDSNASRAALVISMSASVRLCVVLDIAFNILLCIALGDYE
ncbi:uncharacterized protein LOC144353318 [Saccoglossus kowalevskii]